MKVMLTSSLGGSSKVNGKREPSILIQQNGLLKALKSIWIPNARVFIVCADPADYEKNDSVCDCLRQSFPMSGLSISSIESCDERNPEAIERLSEVDVLLLSGGHVPSQNKLIQTLRLRERLQSFNGIVVAWSAGSMNSADTVYAGPELEGEAIDPLYKRWLKGLGLTEINIFPHFQALKDDYLDGMRLIEDITYPDSFVHEIVALNDGSYILIDGEKTTLFGEAYMIKDGKMWQICKDSESVSL